MRLLFLFCLTIFFHNLCRGQANVNKTPEPQWVRTVNVQDKKIIEGHGGFQYLLIDAQDNLKLQSVYRHYAVKVLNAEGVQSLSDISVVFDPSYQKLQFHEIKIIRGNKIIRKLNDVAIKTFQRETSMERSLYDGSVSAVVNLADVRENDIIEYAYSITGFNPINKGNYSSTYYHQYSIPVNRIYTRIITGSQHDLQYKRFEGAVAPEITESGGGIEYKWDIKALDFKLYDNNVPVWYDPHKRVSITTFDSWKAVVDWALPLYRYSDKEVAWIRRSLGDAYSIETKILDLIRLVQDDIRYLGFESGIGAYKPNNPLKVFNQRYGDCKDKSLLLVALLRSEGINAYPILVNTQLKSKIEDELPGHAVFDHCVVNFTYEGKDYFIDPTIANQGGSVENIYFPNYQRGLLLKPGNTGLISIPAKNQATVKINELITVDSIGGSASLIVRSEYTGSKADYMRSYFSTNATKSIQKDYLNYYSSLYAEIAPADEIKFYDYERNTSNKIIVEEYYDLKNFWLSADDSSYIYCEIYPLVLESNIDYAKTTQRDMPYYMGEPYSFMQRTQVDLPEVWAIQDTELKIEGDGFTYENTVQGFGKTISVTHKYELTKEFIPGALVNVMLEQHRKIQDNLSYFLTYNFNLSGFKISWISILLGVIAAGAGIYFFRKIYYSYDPEPWLYAENKPIGSWLVLPAIGLTITPIILVNQIWKAGYFNQHTWTAIFSSGDDHTIPAMLFYGAEIIYNFLFFAFTIFVLIAFYQRRTSAPRLVTFFYAVNFLSPLVYILLAEQLVPTQLSNADHMATLRETLPRFIGAAIWIPYFNISERSKSTFCRQVRQPG